MLKDFPMEACFCECSSQEITGWIWTSRWSVVGGAEFTSAPPKHSVVSLGKYTPFVDYDSLINWKRQCRNSETSPNSDNSQIHRCSTRTKINFSDYIEVDKTGCRKLEGVEWPSGEIVNASQSTGMVPSGTRLPIGDLFQASVLGYILRWHDYGL